MKADIQIGIGGKGQMRIPKPNGFVGKLYPPGPVIILVRIIENPDSVYAVDVDGKKMMRLRRNLGPVGGEKQYRTAIQIKKDLDGVPHTEYPNNNIRFLVLGPGGDLEVWEVSLISQGGDFFLVQQCTERSRCYLENGKARCPGSRFDDRPQTLELFGELFGLNTLPPVAEYQPKPEPSAEGLESGMGRVLWFTSSMGVGAIITPKGVARVHWTQVAKRDGRAFLVPEEVVRYEALVDPRTGSSLGAVLTGVTKALGDTRRDRTTTFELEAQGVR